MHVQVFMMDKISTLLQAFMHVRMHTLTCVSDTHISSVQSATIAAAPTINPTIEEDHDRSYSCPDSDSHSHLYSYS